MTPIKRIISDSSNMSGSSDVVQCVHGSPHSSVAVPALVTTLVPTPVAVAVAVALYYSTAVVVYCHCLHWSLFDSICATTLNLTLFGTVSYTTDQDMRLVGTLLTVLGSILSVVMFITVIQCECECEMSSLRKTYSDMSEAVRMMFKRRIVVPMVQLVTVCVSGASFFAYSEYWSATEALCYSVMHNFSVGSGM
jgi:ABC-type uncharacterized transport system permease subunit